LLPAAIGSGCHREPQRPQDALSVADLIENPVYGQDLKVYGQVSLLGELFCPCFELTSGERTVQVWYDLMEDGDKRRPPVSVAGIQNGDWVTVTGALQSTGDPPSPGNFWASSIERTG
jgi:hypothetical protein